MISTKINNIEDFRTVIEKYNNENFCFRGQVNHYELDGGLTSFITSFQKNGCIPSEMFKWDFFSREILRNYFQEELEKNHNETDKHVFSQAILQHYGWRSFFVDITTDLFVASWFACNKYNDKTTFAMIEDSFEDPIFEIQRTVNYEPKQDDWGYIYVFNKEKLTMSKDYQFVSLVKNNIFTDSTRPFRQMGCLFGGVDKDSRHLSEILNTCLVDILKIDSNVLNDLTIRKGLNQNYLFPSFEEDYIYSSFLGLPRTIFQDGIIPFYKPSLDIPIYDNFFIKRNPHEIAFYSNVWISDFDFKLYTDTTETAADSLINTTFIKTDEFWLYTKSISPNTNSLLTILQELGEFILEVDYPCRIFEDELTIYKKGVRCKLDSEGDIAIAELIIEHPSSSIGNFCFTRPTYYRFANNSLLEIKKSDSCPCDNITRHKHNFDFVQSFCFALDEKKIKLNQIDDKKFEAFLI